MFAETKPPPVLSDDEAKALIAATAAAPNGWRDHMIFSLALATGLRAHELVALNFGDLWSEDSSRALPRRKIKLKVFKRSNSSARAQVVLLNDTVMRRLTEFRMLSRESGQDVSGPAPLFISNRGKRLSLRTLRYLFNVWAGRVGIDDDLSFHCLRHTAITGVYRKTRDIRVAQVFARHASIQSTMIYTHPTSEDVALGIRGLIC